MSKSILMRMICFCAARYYLKKPDQADIVFIKNPRLSDLWPAILNELCYRLRLKKSYRLTSLNVELTNRCNLSCSHCIREGPGSRPPRDMDLTTFRRVVDQSPTVRNLLPFQWGEPLLHPCLYDCIAYASRHGKRVMLTTNGTLLDEGTCEKILAAGLNRLAVSFDGNKETHAAIRQVDPDRILDNLKRFKRIRDRMGATCALDVTMVVSPNTESHVDEFREIFAGLADRIQFIPVFVKGQRRKTCRELWRGVLVVLSNGDVTLCCADPKGEITLGNVHDSSPAELFNSRIMCRIRQRHAQADFPYPCRGCSEYDSTHVSPRFS